MPRDIVFFSGKQYPDFLAERKWWKQLVMRRPVRERRNAG
jgi:methyltransferase-like protein